MTEETNKASGAEVLTTLNHMRRQAMYFRADNDLFPAKEAIQQTDEDRAAIAAVSALIAERDALRAILSKCAAAIGNGASVAADSSIEFLSLIPEEIALYFGKMQEETRRLDWLEADMAKEDEGVGIDCADGRFRFPWLDNGAGGSGGGVYHANYNTLREAIDAIDAVRTSPGAPK